MEHLFFDSIDEMRNQTGSHGPNYLRNHTAERDYFSPLSIVTSIQKPQEYLFSNYMDAWSFCVHTPNKHEFFHETYMHKHNFFELMYVQRGRSPGDDRGGRDHLYAGEPFVSSIETPCIAKQICRMRISFTSASMPLC